MSKINVVLDATMFDLLQLCPARFNYRFNLNKVQLEKPKPLDRGTLVHIGMEEYYNALKEQEIFNHRVARSIQAVQQASVTSDLPVEEISRIIDVLRETFLVHRTDDESMTIIAVEQPFMYVLYEDELLRITMIGKIDLICSKPGYSKVAYDHKSYDRDFPVKRLNNQFTNYATATETNYLFVNRIGFQTSKKPEEKHKRIPLSYDDLFKAQWKKNVVSVVHQYLDYVSSNEWPMNLTSCDKYNRLCEYHEICDTSGEESKIFKLETNFNTAEKWDVSAILGKKS